MYPEEIPPDAAPSERRVWPALERLPDPWRVFHSVAWQSRRGGRPGDGEADFVLLHPDRGLLVIEAKGGGIRLRDGVWYTLGADGEHRIDPFEQAVSSKKALVAYLRETIPTLGWIDAGHAVWFPEVRVRGGLGAAAPDELVLDHDDLTDPVAAIEAVADHWELSTRLDAGAMSAIADKLAPTLTVRHVLADDVADVRARQLVLTETQRRAVAGLRRSRRVVVYGGAGTGKTVLAIERARRLAADGFRVLLTCFNRLLGDSFARRFDATAGVTAGSFHHLAHSWILDAGLPFPEHPDRAFWDEPIGELALEAIDRSGLAFDAVIVDEGQDFDASWFVVLEASLADPDDGMLLVFADRHQAIYREGWEPPPATAAYDLDVNCRNTRQIAEVVARIYGDPPPVDAVDGTEVEFLAAEGTEEARRVAGSALHRLVNEGRIDRREVVVLTRTRDMKDSLIGTRAASLVLGDVTRPSGGIAVETIHRFKGLEADAAVVVLDRLETDRDQALAYIGLSRARAHLVVVGPPEVGGRLGLGYHTADASPPG